MATPRKLSGSLDRHRRRSVRYFRSASIPPNRCDQGSYSPIEESEGVEHALPVLFPNYEVDADLVRHPEIVAVSSPVILADNPS